MSGRRKRALRQAYIERYREVPSVGELRHFKKEYNRKRRGRP